MWVPLLEGSERLGAVEFVVDGINAKSEEDAGALAALVR